MDKNYNTMKEIPSSKALIHEWIIEPFGWYYFLSFGTILFIEATSECVALASVGAFKNEMLMANMLQSIMPTKYK